MGLLAKRRLNDRAPVSAATAANVNANITEQEPATERLIAILRKFGATE